MSTPTKNNHPLTNLNGIFTIVFIGLAIYFSLQTSLYVVPVFVLVCFLSAIVVSLSFSSTSVMNVIKLRSNFEDLKVKFNECKDFFGAFGACMVVVTSGGSMLLAYLSPWETADFFIALCLLGNFVGVIGTYAKELPIIYHLAGHIYVLLTVRTIILLAAFHSLCTLPLFLKVFG